MRMKTQGMGMLRNAVNSFAGKIRSEYGLQSKIKENEYDFLLSVLSPKNDADLGYAVFEVYGNLAEPLFGGFLAPVKVSMHLWEDIYKKHHAQRLTLTP